MLANRHELSEGTSFFSKTGLFLTPWLAVVEIFGWTGGGCFSFGPVWVLEFSNWFTSFLVEATWLVIPFKGVLYVIDEF